MTEPRPTGGDARLSALESQIEEVLRSAGVPETGIAYWWRSPRDQLLGLSPRTFLQNGRLGSGQRVLEVARASVARDRPPVQVGPAEHAGQLGASRGGPLGMTVPNVGAGPDRGGRDRLDEMTSRPELSQGSTEAAQRCARSRAG